MTSSFRLGLCLCVFVCICVRAVSKLSHALLLCVADHRGTFAPNGQAPLLLPPRSCGLLACVRWCVCVCAVPADARLHDLQHRYADLTPSVMPKACCLLRVAPCPTRAESVCPCPLPRPLPAIPLHIPPFWLSLHPSAHSLCLAPPCHAFACAPAGLCLTLLGGLFAGNFVWTYYFRKAMVGLNRNESRHVSCVSASRCCSCCSLLGAASVPSPRMLLLSLCSRSVSPAVAPIAC